jgi:hypothetical protein
MLVACLRKENNMRLIDADALIKKIFPYDVVDKKCYTINAKMIHEAIKEAPTADIKTEVAREIFAEIGKIIFLKHGFNEKRIVVEMDLEELKKIRNKYIGGVGE